MSSSCIEQAFKKQLKESPLPGSNVEWDKPFYIGDLEELRRQHLKWKTLLPRVEPFYGKKKKRKKNEEKENSSVYMIYFDPTIKCEIN